MKTKTRQKSSKAQVRVRPKAAGNWPPPPNFTRILVPLDFSGQSRQALPAAVQLAEQYDGSIILLHVVQPPVVLSAIPGGGQYLVPRDDAKAVKAAKIHLDGLAAEFVPARQSARTLVRRGSPCHQIVSAARKLKVDLIVMATHRYGGLRSTFIGSTAASIVREAPCPVLAVHSS